MTILGQLADVLWNPWLMGLFLLTGLVYTLGSGCFQLCCLRLWLSQTLGSLLRPRQTNSGGLSSLQALATALASTMAPVPSQASPLP